MKIYRPKRKWLQGLIILLILVTAGTVCPVYAAKSTKKQAKTGSGESSQISDGSWKKSGKKTYYIGADGQPLTGIQRIDGEYYYFLASGAQLKKTKKFKKATYYIGPRGHLEVIKKGKKYYHPNGKKMKSTDRENYLTLLRARKFVKMLTKTSDSKKTKLYKCFLWIKKRPWVVRRTFTRSRGWLSTFANDHFQNSAGDCVSDAAALAFMAHVIGYKDIYICMDKKDYRAHIWAEISGKVYDPMFAARDFDQYYASTYRRSGLKKVDSVEVELNYD